MTSSYSEDKSQNSFAAYPHSIADLTSAELTVAAQTGIPPLFAQYLKAVSQTLGCTFAIRVGDPFQRYLMPAAPKPSSVKAKNGNWGFTKGVISEKHELGKIEVDEHNELHQKHRENYEVPKGQPTTLHRLSLQEVLAGINAGEFQQLSSEEDIGRTGRLVVKARDDKAPLGNEYLFSIDLNENDNKRIIPPLAINRELVKAAEPHQEPRPNWWRKEWGDFEEKSNHYYPAQYKHASEKEFSDINVFGVPDGAGNILPITGDQDLFFISRPATLTPLGETSPWPAEVMEEATQVINTFTPTGAYEMISARANMLNRDRGEKLSSIDPKSVARLGCITPYESYLIDVCNAPFNNDVAHFRDLFQHGPENRNPGKPSPIDAPMLYINGDTMIVKKNEDEHVNYLLQNDFLKKNLIDVHPGWNMEKWGAVVAKQIELSQPVSSATLQSYHKHISTPPPNPAALKSYDDYLQKKWIPDTYKQLEQQRTVLPETTIELFHEKMKNDEKAMKTYSAYMEQKWVPTAQKLMERSTLPGSMLKLYEKHLVDHPDENATAKYNAYLRNSITQAKIMPAESLLVYSKNIGQTKQVEAQKALKHYMDTTWVPHVKSELEHKHSVSPATQQLYNRSTQSVSVTIDKGLLSKSTAVSPVPRVTAESKDEVKERKEIKSPSNRGPGR